jgi:Toprim-like
MDMHGNAVFPHFDQLGLCGYELKNRNFTGFAPGGEKGLWSLHEKDGDARLIFAESAIDALSHEVLFPDDSARYKSIGGQTNPRQPDLIHAEVLRMRTGSEIIAAMDADDAGRVFSDLVQLAVAQAARPDLSFRVHVPEREGDDWNQVLKDSRHSFPVAHV